MKTKMIFLVLFVWTLGACSNDKDYLKLGWEYWNKKETQKAFEAFNKACGEENFEACWYLGNFYKLGIKIKKDKQKAKEYYQKTIDYANKACEKNETYACGILQGYEDALGTTKDKAKADIFYKKAFELAQKECLAGDYYKSCNFLGIFYSKGKAVRY